MLNMKGILRSYIDICVPQTAMLRRSMCPTDGNVEELHRYMCPTDGNVEEINVSHRRQC